MKNIIGNFKKIIYLTLVFLLADCGMSDPERFTLYYGQVRQTYIENDDYCVEYMVFLTPNFHNVLIYYWFEQDNEWKELEYTSYLILPEPARKSPSKMVGVGDVLCFNTNEALILLEITASDKPVGKTGVGISPTISDTLNLAMLF